MNSYELKTAIKNAVKNAVKEAVNAKFNPKKLSDELIKEIKGMTRYQVAAKYKLTVTEASAVKELFDKR